MADKKLYEVVKIEHFNSFSVLISGKHSIIIKILGDAIVAVTAIARKGNENNIFDSKKAMNSFHAKNKKKHHFED